MKKLLFLAVGFLVLGCADRNDVTTYSNNHIKLDSGLYVKEYILGLSSASAVRYIYIQCDSAGKFIKGLSSSHSIGKTKTGTVVVSKEDSSEEDIYKALRDKYGANSDFGLYLKLRDKYEEK